MQLNAQATNLHLIDTSTLNQPSRATILKILQINIRGINQIEKFDSLCEFLRSLNTDIDVVVIGETWLKKGRTTVYNIPGYQGTFSCRNTSAGGLAVFVRSDLQLKVKNNTVNEGYHHIGIEINAGRTAVTIHGFYRPPDYDATRFISSIEEILSTANLDAPFFLVGDMNLPANNINNREFRKYQALLSSYNMAVSNTLVTRPSSNNVLDHVVCSIGDSPRVCNYTIDCPLSDHSYVLTTFKMKFDRVKKTLSKTWTNYQAVDQQFKQFLQESNWGDLEPHDRLATLTARYRQLVGSNSKTTTVEVKLKSDCCPWYNFDVWKLGKIRDNVLRRSKLNRHDQRLQDLLDHANRRLKDAKKRAKTEYYNGIFSSTNPKVLWRRINELLGCKTKECPALTLHVNGMDVNEPGPVAAKLNEHFTSVGVNLASGLSSDGDINKFNTMRFSNNTMFLRPASVSEVFDTISALETKKACGYDGFPVSALQKHRAHLAPLLCTCFNDCISQGTYPDCLKIAIVTPIFKGGDQKNPSNYRPISVLPAINKVFEKLLFNRLVNFLTVTKRLYKHQFGFREGSSTEVAVLELVDDISLALDDGNSAGSVFLDLSKAFDTINHEMLMKKMDACGVRGLPKALFFSYLTGRSQQVVVSGVRSSMRTISAGVPQGSNLGPLLFLIYVNDLPKLQLKGKPILFADDTAISYSGPTPTQVIQHMKDDMKLILNYLENNLLALNLGKSKMMMFRLKKLPAHPELQVGEQIIEEVSTFKYLGVHLDNRLSWDAHVREIVANCASLCGVLRKLCKTVPQHVLLKIYYAFIQSRYLYGIAAWGSAHKTVIKEIQVQQNRCLKAIYKLPYLHPTHELYRLQNNILPILGMYTQRIAVLMYKILNNQNLHHNWHFSTAQHQHDTRSSNQIQRQRFRTELGRKRFPICGPNVFNRLPGNIKEATTLTKLKQEMVLKIRSEINNFLPR